MFENISPTSYNELFLILAKLWPKHHFLYLYGGHFENVQHMQLYVINIGFLDPENMGVDTKIVFLSDLDAKIWPKT